MTEQTQEQEFPVAVFKDKGPHQRPGGTFADKAANSQEELDNLLSDGWHLTLVEALGGESQKDIKDPGSNLPPTLDELKAKANDLKLEFPANIGIKKLQAMVDEALKAKE